MGSKWVAVGDVASINSRQYSLKENWKEIAYLDTGSVFRGSINEIQYFDPTKDKIPSRCRRKVKNRSIIYSMVRPNQEHYAILDNPLDNMLVSTGFSVIDAKTESIEPKYLYYVLTSKEAISYFNALAEQSVSTYPTLGNADLFSYSFRLPEKKKQEAIVRVVDSIDSKIRINNRINDYLEELADAIFKERFSETEKTTALSELASVTMGQSPSGSSYNENRIGETFYQGRGEFGWRFPTQRLFTTEPKRMAKTGDVLMSVRAPVGDINVAYEDCCIGRGLAAIHSDYQSFCLYLMRSLRKTLDSYNGDGTVFGSINKKALNDLVVPLPSEEELDSFENVVALLDEMICNNEAKNRNLQKLRDTLLPRLMSGKIDVAEVDLAQLKMYLEEPYGSDSIDLCNL